MSYNDDDNFIIIEDHNAQYENNTNYNSPTSSHRNISPSNENRRDHRNRSRSRSYDDRRRSGGSNRSRSPRRSRSPHRHSRERSRRRSPQRNSGSSNRSNAQLDRELGLKYRWEKTVYVSNIPYDTRWTDLKDLFRNKVGDIMYCEVFEKDSKSLGVAAIEFKTVDDAERAVSVMHQYEIGGRKISCRIDNEGYKTRQAKESALENSHNSSSSSYKHSSSSSNNNNNNNNDKNNQHQSNNLALAALAGLGSQNNILNLLGPNSGQIASILNLFGGSNSTASQNALLDQMAAYLKVDGPVTNRIFIASLDYKVDEHKIKEVFTLAGKVQNVSLFKDRDGKSRGMSVVEYESPLEALNAVSMFNNQTLNDRQMTVRFDTKPPRDEDSNSKSSSSSHASRLPSGLKSIGTGIGLNSLLGGAGGGGSGGVSSNNLALNALSVLGLGVGNGNSNPDLSALSSLGLNLNGTAPNLMSGLLGAGNSNSIIGMNNGRSNNGINSSNNISKIFVKNIPFSWDERKLKEKFRQAGHIEYVEIKIKDGKSRGCGLIRFSNSEQANKAVELFNGSRFEGRTLEVKLDQIP